MSRPAAGRGGFLAIAEVALKLHKRGRVGRIARIFLKFLVIGVAFAAFLIWGLSIAEDSVNHLMGRAADRAVFSIGESPDGRMELTLLGEHYLGPSFTKTLHYWKSRMAELLHLRPIPAGEGEEVLK